MDLLLCIPKDQETYNYMSEIYVYINQSGENPINGFLSDVTDTDVNCDFYIIPDTYNNFEDFKQDYYDKTITIDNMQKYQ